jgi:hypothetical protein
VNHPPQPLHLAIAVLGAGLIVLAPGALRAAPPASTTPSPTSYKIQSIFKLGDKIGDVTTDPQGDVEVGALNDNGQIVFVTENAAAGAGEILVQYNSDGKFTPIVVGGGSAPGGTWSKPVSTYGPMTMNQHGNIAFAVDITTGSQSSAGTFLWDFTAQKTTAVALRGMPATGTLTFETGGFYNAAININGEIAFPAMVKNAAGEAAPGLFFQGQDNKLQPVALPDQSLPGGGKVALALYPSLNDAGTVAFLAQRPTDPLPSAYLWAKGTPAPVAVAVIGMDAPGGGKITGVGAAFVNNNNSSVLVSAQVTGSSTWALYRFANGQLTPVVTPGQDMPGGGKFRALLFPGGALPVLAIGPANDAGQHPFVAAVTDGTATRTGAYLLNPDGTLSLILTSGTTTDLGTITAVGTASAPPSNGVAINNKGQVAVPVRIGTGPGTLALLTPASP